MIDKNYVHTKYKSVKEFVLKPTEILHFNFTKKNPFPRLESSWGYLIVEERRPIIKYE